jgi:hypothetical protein
VIDSWALLVLLGIEKVRIVPGMTASNPLDLYDMPYVMTPGHLARNHRAYSWRVAIG